MLHLLMARMLSRANNEDDFTVLYRLKGGSSFVLKTKVRAISTAAAMERFDSLFPDCERIGYPFRFDIRCLDDRVLE